MRQNSGRRYNMAICKRCGGFSKRTGFCRLCISIIKTSVQFGVKLQDEDKIKQTIERGLYAKNN
jgi:hypothetical protein